MEGEHIRRAGHELPDSPWSEYRRLILAELERINGTLDQMRSEAERMRTEVALLRDRMDKMRRNGDKGSLFEIDLKTLVVVCIAIGAIVYEVLRRSQM